ncbi:MAG: F0F1 ATP synthase subunit delta [Erysipelothrix sp.]|nr:F0F1 ATP synthase subunit delta [Erysipelothrix sp.]
MISLNVYALALYEVALERSLKFYDSVLSFQTMLEDESVRAVFTRTYADPSILDPLFESLGYSNEVIKLLKIMQASRLLVDYDRFVDLYRDLLIEHHELVRVEIVSAVEISDFSAIDALVTARYTGRIERVASVDASLIKGMVMRINHDVFDTSIKKRLDSVLKEAG